MLHIAHGQARPSQARAFEAVEVRLHGVEAVLAPSRVAGQPHLVRALVTMLRSVYCFDEYFQGRPQNI